MKFFEYRQNNSVGRYDNAIPDRVYIYAKNPDEANKLAETFGIYFNGVADGIDCGCCGDRWREANKYDGLMLEELPHDGNEYTRVYYKGSWVDLDKIKEHVKKQDLVLKLQ